MNEGCLNKAPIDKMLKSPSDFPCKRQCLLKRSSAFRVKNSLLSNFAQLNILVHKLQMEWLSIWEIFQNTDFGVLYNQTAECSKFAPGKSQKLHKWLSSLLQIHKKMRKNELRWFTGQNFRANYFSNIWMLQTGFTDTAL